MTDYRTLIDEFAREPEAAPLGAVLQRISDIPAQKLSWLWPGRIPLGKLTLLAGDPGLGKSFVTLDIAARVTRGTAWPDGTANAEPGDVIILSAEDDAADTIRPRLEAAGANLDRVHILQAVRRMAEDGKATLDHFSLQTDITALQDAAVSPEVQNARLIIIDPVSAYLGSTDSHVNSKVRGLLAPLAALAQALGIAVLLIDHLSKSNRQALYRPNGSIAFTAAARAVWFFAKNPDDSLQRFMLPGKLNLAPEQTGLSYSLRADDTGTVTVAWGESVNMTADAVLQPEDTEDRSERMEAMDWLRDQLATGPLPSDQLKDRANKAHYAWRTVRRAQNALGIKPVKNGFGGGWSWQLPEDGHEPPKMATQNAWTPSSKVDTFDGHSYTLLGAPGLDCACNSCPGKFRTVAGWRAHIMGKRCTPVAEAAD